MSYQVLVSNPVDADRSAVCEAVLEHRAGHPKVPVDLYDSLGIPGWAMLEFEGRVTHMSVEPSDDDLVHVPLAMLTALGFERDRSTGELRWFEYSLPFIVEVETS